MIKFVSQVRGGILDKFKSITDCKVYEGILSNCDLRYVFFNNLHNRKQIANEYGYNEITVRKSIARLLDSGLIVKTENSGKGVYFVNKSYVESAD